MGRRSWSSSLPPWGLSGRAVVIGSIWLGSLPQVLRDAGLDVDVYPGWETRSRSSGGYDALLGIQVHHTASSGLSPANDMKYMWENAPAKPIGACYIAPDGKWTVGAAGATNTSGKGGPLVTSRGIIPLDAANRYVISLEAANRGDGTPWPEAQLWSYVVGVGALNRAYFGGVLALPGDVHGHFEWTTRKVDPAGNSWYATGADKWNMDKFRADVLGLIAPPPVYERIVMATDFEFANAQRWDTRGFGEMNPALKAGLDPGEYKCELAGSPGKVGAMVNVTIVAGSPAGYATVWPSGPRPDKSKINWSATGQAIANEISVPLAADGSFRIFISAKAHIIVDLTGYWTR